MSKTDEGRDYAAHYKAMWEDALAKWRKDAERISALEAELATLRARLARAERVEKAAQRLLDSMDCNASSDTEFGGSWGVAAETELRAALREVKT